MISLIRWLHLNYKYRIFPLPNDLPRLQKAGGRSKYFTRLHVQGLWDGCAIGPTSHHSETKFISMEFSAIDFKAVPWFVVRCVRLLFLDWRVFLKSLLT